MGILDSGPEEPRSKLRRYIIIGVAFALLLSGGLWYLLHFYSEKRAAASFLDALVASDLPRAYQLWKPAPGYTMKDFLEDWGENGYYGPVKSYRIDSVVAPKKGGSGVVVIVEVSPFTPFPDDRDAQRTRRTKEVRLWVQSKDKSLSYPP